MGWSKDPGPTNLGGETPRFFIKEKLKKIIICLKINMFTVGAVVLGCPLAKGIDLVNNH